MRTVASTLLALLTITSLAAAQVDILVPEFKTAPPPSWVKPGVRVTWYMGSSSRQGAYVRPNPDGKLKNDRGDRADLVEAGSSAGHGYTELTVLAMERGKVVCEARTYLLPDGNPSGPATLVAATSSIGPASCFGEYWVNPDVLRKLVVSPPEGLNVGALKHTVDGEARDAAMILVKSDSGSSSWTYDLVSGVLLQASTRGSWKRGDGGTMKDGTNISGEGTTGTVTMFRDYTQLDLPWLGMKKPDWVATQRRLEYDGGYTMVVPGAPEMPPLPLAQRLELVEHGADWATYKRRMVNGPRSLLDGGGTGAGGIPVTPAEEPFATGVGTVTPLWIPPAGLARLRVGQSLAKNRITEVEYTVVHNGPDGRGIEICAIRAQNRLHVIDYVYDRRSGLAVHTSTREKVTNTIVTWDLVR
jgi:hypothetical protein